MNPRSDHLRVLIVDDSAIVRHGIVRALAHEPEARSLDFVGEADSVATAIAATLRLNPDVVLLDLRLPDGSGLEVCRQLRSSHPDVCILVFTSSSDNRSVYDAIVAGAHGYLMKEIDPAALAHAIVEAHAGKPVFSHDVSTRMVDIVRDGHARRERAAQLARLSPQETRVLAAIAAGHANKDIAHELNLSETTVRNYIARVFEKLGLSNRAQATALFLESQSQPND